MVFDQIGYVQIAIQLKEKGFLNFCEPLRTYLYPLLISTILKLTPAPSNILRLIISAIQYLIYIGTLFYLYKQVTSNQTKQKTNYLILFLGMLNPYLLSATTHILTDSISCCLNVLSILFLGSANTKKDLFKFKNLLIAYTCLYLSIMVRPANLIFLLIFVLYSAFTLFREQFRNLKYVIFSSILPGVIVIPQLWMNIRCFKDFTPIIHDSLYQLQSHLAVTAYKYGTTIIPKADPQLTYHTPFIATATTSIFSFLLHSPLKGLLLLATHVFALLDWEYVEMYITAYYPPSRLVASGFLYLSWFLIGGGVLRFLFLNRKNLVNSFFTLEGLLLFTTIMYTLFMITTQVESRFGFPIFLLLLPFSSYSFTFFNELPNIKRWKWLSFCILWTLLLFILSFNLDLTTGRINWFQYLKF